jgi:hypothetical protein
MDRPSSRYLRDAAAQDALLAIGLALIVVPSVIAAVWLALSWFGAGPS